MKQIINKITNVSTKHPLWTVIIIIFISIITVPGVLKIELDNNIRGFLSKDFKVLKETDYVEHVFNMPKSMFFISVEADNIYTKNTLEYLHLLHSQMSASIKDIDKIIINNEEYNSFNKKLFKFLSTKTKIDSFIINNKIYNTINQIDDSDYMNSNKKNSAVIINGEKYLLFDRKILQLLINDIDSIIINNIKHKETKTIINSLIEDVNSIINAVDVTSENDVLETFDFIKEKNGKKIIPSTNKEFQQLKILLEDNENYKGLFYSKIENDNGNPLAWIITVEVSENNLKHYYDVIDYLEELLETTKDYNFTSKIFGIDYTNRYMNKESKQDVQKQILIVACVIMFVFFLNFRTPAGVILPELNTIISVFWIFGLMGHLGIKFSIIGLLILPVLFAVTSSYSIHSLNQFYKEQYNYKKNETKSKHIANSMSHILITISIAGLTTVVSFISLVTNNIIHIKTFGIFAAIGVIISVTLSLTLIPALLVLTQKNKKPSKYIQSFNNSFIDKLIRKTTYFIIKHRFLVFIILLSLAIIFLTGIYFIKTDSSFVTMFDENHKIRQLSKYFSKHFGGVTTLNITIDTRPDLNTSIKKQLKKFINTNKTNINNAPNNKTDILLKNNNENSQLLEKNNQEDPFDNTLIKENELMIDLDSYDYSKYNGAVKSKILKEIESLSNHLKTVEGVGRVYSYADIVKRFHYIWHNKDEHYKKIPNEDNIILDYKETFSGDDNNANGIIDNIENFIDPTYNKLNIIVTLQDKGEKIINTGDYERIEKEIKDYIESHFKGIDIDYYISGWAILHKNVQREIVRGQLISILFSFFVIFIIVTFLFKSPISGLISIIPLSASIFVTFGLMGYLGISLDVATALISAVAIGIAVDDTIHYMLLLRKFKLELNDDIDIETLIYKTSSFTSKAIIYTSVALILGFLVVMFSTFIPVRQFAYLTAFTLFVATIATLWALPSILLIFPKLIGVKNKKGNSIEIDIDKEY